MPVFYSDIVAAARNEKRVRNQNLRGKLLSTTAVLPACTAAADCIIQIANFSPSDSIKSVELSSVVTSASSRRISLGLRAIGNVSEGLIDIGADTVFGRNLAISPTATTSNIVTFAALLNKTLYELLTRELDGRTVPTAGYAPHVDKRLALILTRTVGSVAANNEIFFIQYVSASSAGAPLVGVSYGSLYR